MSRNESNWGEGGVKIDVKYHFLLWYITCVEFVSVDIFHSSVKEMSWPLIPADTNDVLTLWWHTYQQTVTFNSYCYVAQISVVNNFYARKVYCVIFNFMQSHICLYFWSMLYVSNSKFILCTFEVQIFQSVKHFF